LHLASNSRLVSHGLRPRRWPTARQPISGRPTAALGGRVSGAPTPAAARRPPTARPSSSRGFVPRFRHRRAACLCAEVLAQNGVDAGNTPLRGSRPESRLRRSRSPGSPSSGPRPPTGVRLVRGFCWSWDRGTQCRANGRLAVMCGHLAPQQRKKRSNRRVLAEWLRPGAAAWGSGSLLTGNRACAFNTRRRVDVVRAWRVPAAGCPGPPRKPAPRTAPLFARSSTPPLRPPDVDRDRGRPNRAAPGNRRGNPPPCVFPPTSIGLEPRSQRFYVASPWVPRVDNEPDCASPRHCAPRLRPPSSWSRQSPLARERLDALGIQLHGGGRCALQGRRTPAVWWVPSGPTGAAHWAG